MNERVTQLLVKWSFYDIVKKTTKVVIETIYLSRFEVGIFYCANIYIVNSRAIEKRENMTLEDILGIGSCIRVGDGTAVSVYHTTETEPLIEFNWDVCWTFRAASLTDTDYMDYRKAQIASMEFEKNTGVLKIVIY